jgi:AcrR family transcriptional regulator
MIDRRVARTRAQLQQAHLRLMIEKGYEAVTVEDICAAANVGRSTFYAHYPNKEALHRGGLDALRQQLASHQERAAEGATGWAEAGLAFSLPMFDHARDHLDLYRALAGGRGGAIAIEGIRRMLCDLVRSELVADGRLARDAVRREFTVRYIVGAYLAVLTWWLDGGAEQPPEEMDAMFRRLAADGLRAKA